MIRDESFSLTSLKWFRLYKLLLFCLRLYENWCNEDIAEKIKLLFFKAKKISLEL